MAHRQKRSLYNERRIRFKIIEQRQQNTDRMSGKKRHNYKNLKIWLLGIEIAKDISDVLINFPKHEQYDLSSQMNRSSISIPSNIAEGSSRTDKSFKHFIDISLGSSFELITQLIIARHKNYINENTHQTIENKIEKFQRMSMGFQNGLE